jgi:hypothetical protein
MQCRQTCNECSCDEYDVYLSYQSIECPVHYESQFTVNYDANKKQYSYVQMKSCNADITCATNPDNDHECYYYPDHPETLVPYPDMDIGAIIGTAISGVIIVICSAILIYYSYQPICDRCRKIQNSILYTWFRTKRRFMNRTEVNV